MLITVEDGHTMILTQTVIFLLFFCVTNTWASTPVDPESTDLKKGYNETQLLDNQDVHENNTNSFQKVRIQLYYETLCRHCVRFGLQELAPVIENCGSNLDIQIYPFGNAMIKDNNGTLEFKCQHGPPECYGNKLHACALDKLNHTTALQYTICLMNSTENLGSDDKSADRCGQSMGIDSESIKECAKGTRGIELLKYYGEESEKTKYPHVPYILINGNATVQEDFKKAACGDVSNPPASS